MPHIDVIPPEILDLIMLQAADIAMGEGRPVSPSRALFPFNVASVCTRWLDISKANPQFWRRVVFDVADDPTPFLDTFALFDNPDEDRDIVVFSSLRNSPDHAGSHEDEDCRQLENARVLTIYTLLEPSIPRFANITFDVVYQSSLPSACRFFAHPLPRLGSLSLRCLNYDFDDDVSEVEMKIKGLSPRPVAEFPALKMLSLTGYAFMELYHLDHDWYLDFNAQLSDKFQLYVTHFKFQREHHNFSRAMLRFMEMLSNMHRTIHTIHLSDLSLEHHPEPRRYGSHLIKARHLTFDNVSRDFLSAFFSQTNILGQPHLTFRNCSIPHHTPKYKENATVPSSLTLEHLPFPLIENSPKTTRAINHAHLQSDDSLYHAITTFHTRDVRLYSCDGVNDRFLDWFGSLGLDDESEFLVETLHIHDCTRFTSGGLHEFVSTRSWCRHAWSPVGGGIIDIPPLGMLKVSGKGPSLAKEDAAWFVDNLHQTKTHVEWTVGTLQ